MADLPVVDTNFVLAVREVVPPPPPPPPPPTIGFTVSISPSRLEVNPGEVATFQVTLTPVGDFFARIHMEVLNWPAQYPAPIFPVNDVRPRADRQVQMILPAGWPAGEHPLTLRCAALPE